MKHSAKIVVSIPAGILASLERARRRLGKSRSAAVTLAVQQWLRAQGSGQDDQRYTEAYLRDPEASGETAALAAAVTATWKPRPLPRHVAR